MESLEGKITYPYGRSPISNTSSSTEEGAASSSSFDNSSIGSFNDSEFGRPAKKEFTKSKHSEVEKRRRRKINALIEELSSLVPTGCPSDRKPDKLTVLKVAVQHLRILGLKSEQSSAAASRYKPSHMEEKEMESLLENATKGFLFVVSSDRLQILYMSDKVKKILNFSPAELIGKCLFNIVHAKDVTMLNEQLTSVQEMGSMSSPMFIGKKPEDASKEMNKTMCKRAFYCRFRNNFDSNDDGKHFGVSSAKKSKADTFSLVDDDMKKYSIVHCTGLLKSWLPAGKLMGNSTELSTCCYFHGVARKVTVLSENSDLYAALSSEEPLQFTCRCSPEGKFLLVDPRMVTILGYLPQDLIGQNCYKLIYVNDVQLLQNAMDEVKEKQSFEIISTGTYRMISTNDCLIPVVASLFAFRNPVTEEIEYIVQQTTVVK